MSLTLSELAKLTDSKLIGDPDFRITGIDNLNSAQSCHLSFLDNQAYTKQLASSQAGAILLSSKNLPKKLDGNNYLINDNPSLVLQKAIEAFLKPLPSGFANIHPTAIIHDSTTLGSNTKIGPYAVIDQECHIGSNTTISAHTIIGPKTTIGDNCHIHAHVTIYDRSQIGNHVTIQPGAVIGSSGFGYHTDKQGKHLHLNHLGNVIVEDDVDIGANTTIDRARFKSTIIHSGTKIDNLVQIAHQVELGQDNMIVSQVGISGSTKTGRNVVMGGQVGVAGHITIADQAILTARCGVSKSLDKADVYYGAPAMADKEFKQHFLALRRVGKMAKRFKELEKRFAHLLEDDDDD